MIVIIVMIVMVIIMIVVIFRLKEEFSFIVSGCYQCKITGLNGLNGFCLFGLSGLELEPPVENGITVFDGGSAGLSQSILSYK